MSRKGSSGMSVSNSNFHGFPNFDGDPLSYSDAEHKKRLNKEDEWFGLNSNSNSWSSDLTSEEKTAIQMHVNGSGTLNEKYSKALDGAVEKFDLGTGIKVYRATDNFTDAKVGEIIHESGHPSTSVVNMGNWGRDALLEIDVPSGKGRGIWVGKRGEPLEHEFMLRRNASYKVTGRSVDSDGTVRLKAVMVT